jgi:hypothetical protein
MIFSLLYTIVLMLPFNCQTPKFEEAWMFQERPERPATSQGPMSRLHDDAHHSFSSMEESNWDVYVLTADGSQLVRLTSGPGPDSCTCWSPKGSSLSRDAGAYPDSSFYAMRLDGYGAARLAE